MIEFPTILVGVFVMQVVAVPMGTYSALAGALALAIILTPYVAVYTHEALREIPSTYREAGFPSGSRGRSRLQNPRADGEARHFDRRPHRNGQSRWRNRAAPLHGRRTYESYPSSITKPVGAVPLLIYQLVQSPNPVDHATAWGASLVLLAIFLGIFIPIRLSLKEVRL